MNNVEIELIEYNKEEILNNILNDLHKVQDELYEISNKNLLNCNNIINMLENIETGLNMIRTNQ